MFHRELSLVRDSEDTTLKIISENGDRSKCKFPRAFPVTGIAYVSARDNLFVRTGWLRKIED